MSPFHPNRHTFFNILVRTSGRPNYFAACIDSIRQQNYRHYQILVSYDDAETYEYVRHYPDVQAISVEKETETPPRRTNSSKHLEVFLPNLYFNTLMQHCREGFVLFLDDDDCLLDKDALKNLDQHITGPDNLLFWRVRFSQQRLVPSDTYFRRPPAHTQINTSGFTFHTKYIPEAQWDGWRVGDYFVASKLYEKIPDKIYLDRVFTGMQDAHRLPGLGFRNDKVISMTDMKMQYERMGYLPPVRVLTQKEAHDFLRQVHTAPPELPLDWEKGYAAGSRLFYEIATRPAILERVSALLGRDVILWGCNIVAKRAGTDHPWHCDLEASAPQSGKTLNVWIGLKNVQINSGLSFIPFSHSFAKTIQQIRHEKGIGRGQADQTKVLEWARENHPDTRIMAPDMTDGEALFFNGKMWHASFNKTKETRFALLIQYATPDTPIRLPDINNFEWPFRQLAHPKPPVILLKGDDRAGLNRIVQAPVSRHNQGRYLMSANRIYPLELPLPLPEGQHWKPFPIYNGTTANLQNFSCHVSALAPGHSPHPPHTHKEEEILIILHGEADVILPQLATKNKPRRRLTRGDFVYYPPHFEHTLESVGQEPVNYLMFKWYNPMHSPLQQLGFEQHHGIAGREAGTGKPINYGLLFEGSTTCLKKLHCHTSVLQPGASYAAHRDPYDVAIIVLEGQVETLGQLVDTHHVIFYPAGTLHGMANPTDRVARYLVFEFHGHQALQDRKIKPAFLPAIPDTTPLKRQQVPAKPGKQAEYEQLLAEYRALESSYSLRIGRAITKTLERSLGWLPFVRRAMGQNEGKD